MSSAVWQTWDTDSGIRRPAIPVGLPVQVTSDCRINGQSSTPLWPVATGPCIPHSAKSVRRSVLKLILSRDSIDRISS